MSLIKTPCKPPKVIRFGYMELYRVGQKMSIKLGKFGLWWILLDYLGLCIGGDVENWTPVLKQLLPASTCLVKDWLNSLQKSSTCKALSEAKILNVSHVVKSTLRR